MVSAGQPDAASQQSPFQKALKFLRRFINNLEQNLEQNHHEKSCIQTQLKEKREGAEEKRQSIAKANWCEEELKEEMQQYQRDAECLRQEMDQEEQNAAQIRLALSFGRERIAEIQKEMAGQHQKVENEPEQQEEFQHRLQREQCQLQDLLQFSITLANLEDENEQKVAQLRQSEGILEQHRTRFSQIDYLFQKNKNLLLKMETLFEPAVAQFDSMNEEITKLQEQLKRTENEFQEMGAQYLQLTTRLQESEEELQKNAASEVPVSLQSILIQYDVANSCNRINSNEDAKGNGCLKPLLIG